jgi:RNA polymerase sigma-70 factor, ECF subfamily
MSAPESGMEASNAADAAVAGVDVISQDQRLLAAAQAGHREAIEALFEKVARYLDDVAHHLVTQPLDPRDVVQETLVTLLRKLPRLTVKISLRGLVYGEVRNAARGLRTAYPHSSELQCVAEPDCDDGPTFLLEDLKTVLAHIPPSQRNILLLHFFDGMELEDIAELQRVPVGTIKSRMQRGLNRARSDRRVRSFFLP